MLVCVYKLAGIYIFACIYLCRYAGRLVNMLAGVWICLQMFLYGEMYVYKVTGVCIRFKNFGYAGRCKSIIRRVFYMLAGVCKCRELCVYAGRCVMIQKNV